jgi:hypothetical protein
MPDDRQDRPRTAAPRMSYTTRVHLKRRLRAIDYKFVAAIGALVLLTLLVIRYAR